MKKTFNWTPIFWRFARGLVAVLLAGVAVRYGHSEWYLAIAPFLLALDKGIRMR